MRDWGGEGGVRFWALTRCRCRCRGGIGRWCKVGRGGGFAFAAGGAGALGRTGAGAVFDGGYAVAGGALALAGPSAVFLHHEFACAVFGEPDGGAIVVAEGANGLAVLRGPLPFGAFEAGAGAGDKAVVALGGGAVGEELGDGGRAVVGGCGAVGGCGVVGGTFAGGAADGAVAGAFNAEFGCVVELRLFEELGAGDAVAAGDGLDVVPRDGDGVGVLAGFFDGELVRAG